MDIEWLQANCLGNYRNPAKKLKGEYDSKKLNRKWKVMKIRIWRDLEQMKRIGERQKTMERYKWKRGLN